MESNNQDNSASNAEKGSSGKQSQHAKRRQQKKMKKEQAAQEKQQQSIPDEPSAKESTHSRQESEKGKKMVYQKKHQKGEEEDNEEQQQPKKKKYFSVVKPGQAKDADNQINEKEENEGNEDDNSMKGDSNSQTTFPSQSQNEEESKKDGGRFQRNQDKKFQYPKIEKLKPINFGRKDHVLPSDETGFKGAPDTWFDEDRYKKPKHKANFDAASKHDYYFNSYSSHHIHEEMLKDQHRTITYQNAIENNRADFKDKIVLDIGCGTGILSIFAARAGAKHVYAIDAAEIALFAREIIKDNGLQDKVTVFHGKMEDLDLPFKEGEIDIIISEWMGYFLLYESMLDCVLWARDKYLNKQTGKMLPDRALMYVAAIEDSVYMGEKTNFWENVYGVNMSIMTKGIFKDPVVDTVPAENLMSDSCCILDIDLVKMDKKEVEFSNFYSLTMQYSDKVHALVFWFDTVFGDLTNPACLTTSPLRKYTHWKQSVLYIERPLKVDKGDTLYGSIAVRQDRTNFRELNIKVSYHLDTKRNRGGPKHFDQQYKFK